MISAYIKPAYGAVWRVEDMMRLVRRLVASTSTGHSIVKAQQSCMDRYARAFGFELACHDDL